MPTPSGAVMSPERQAAARQQQGAAGPDQRLHALMQQQTMQQNQQRLQQQQDRQNFQDRYNAATDRNAFMNENADEARRLGASMSGAGTTPVGSSAGGGQTPPGGGNPGTINMLGAGQRLRVGIGSSQAQNAINSGARYQGFSVGAPGGDAIYGTDPAINNAFGQDADAARNGTLTPAQKQQYGVQLTSADRRAMLLQQALGGMGGGGAGFGAAMPTSSAALLAGSGAGGGGGAGAGSLPPGRYQATGSTLANFPAASGGEAAKMGGMAGAGGRPQYGDLPSAIDGGILNRINNPDAISAQEQQGLEAQSLDASASTRAAREREVREDYARRGLGGGDLEAGALRDTRNQSDVERLGGLRELRSTRALSRNQALQSGLGQGLEWLQTMTGQGNAQQGRNLQLLSMLLGEA